MAFDTVVDKTQLESAITASANAIREKTGSTDLIEWLADKGFADAIAAIEAGGGNNWWFTTYTPSTDIAPPTMRHEMGKVPNVAGMYCLDFDKSITGTQYVRHVVIVNATNHYDTNLSAYEYKPSSLTTTSRACGPSGSEPTSSTSYPIYITEYAVRVQPGRTSAQPWYMQAGKTYVFFAGVIE